MGTGETKQDGESVATPVKLAIFDFDGTCISGNSPVLLVRYLVARKMLPPSVVARIILWGIAYKLRLPQNEAWVRGLVFRAFNGMPVSDVDQFLRDFYDEVVSKRFRIQADEAMRAHAADGCIVMVVSASFEPIIQRAMQTHPFSCQVSTRMKRTEEGTYCCEVEGLPVEGEEKLCAVQRYADEHFGVGMWEIVYAYGDHHSDRAVLGAAQVSCAVCPDRPLARTARERGWKILEWG